MTSATTAETVARYSALIVEDDRALSALGAEMLAEFDLQVEQVETAEEAIALLQQNGGSIGVVVADVNLPGRMNGVALAHSVSVLWPAVAVIVTSGDPRDGIGALPDNAVFVPKPWRPLDIVAAAERAARADHSIHAVRL